MSDSVSPPARSREPLAGFLVFLAALALSLVYTHAGWSNMLLDTHPFRQAQTALSAFWMVRDGFHLDYATPVMGAPWSIPMEFPLYQGIVAAIVRATGLDLQTTGRAVTLFFFYASLPAIFLLLRRLGISTAQRWLFLALVLTCPVYVFYSRAFLIESTALCLGCWFLYAFHAALEPKRPILLAAALLLGLALGMTKVTTYAVFLAAAVAFGIAALAARRHEWRALLTRGAVAALPGVFAATLWVVYSDAVKRRNVFGVSITSAQQRDWNYGPPLQRFELSFWQQFGAQLERAVFPWVAIPLLLALALIFLRGRWRVVVSLLVVALAGPLVFANLYFVHDYYLYANAVFFLAFAALPLKRLFESPALSLPFRIAVVALVCAAQFSGYLRVYHPMQVSAEKQPPEIMRALKAVTQPDDVFIGFGMGWSSIFPFYSERRAMMVPDLYVRDETAIRRALGKIAPARIAAVVLYRFADPKPEYFAPWLKELAMDENPFMQTGEYTIHLRKDMEPDALRALAHFPLKDVLLYQGLLAKPGEKPPLIFWTDQLADRQCYAMMSPTPVKASVPFGLGAEPIEGKLAFMAHTPSEIDIPIPAGARNIEAEFGLSPAAYASTDGVEFEIIQVEATGARKLLFHRPVQPALLSSDRGPQTLKLETAVPLEGHLLFRTLPGGSPNYDWAYWSHIEVR